MTRALATLDATRIGRRGSRSTHTPMNRPATTGGAIRTATSTPVSNVPAPKRRMAASGSASRVIWLPTTAIV